MCRRWHGGENETVRIQYQGVRSKVRRWGCLPILGEHIHGGLMLGVWVRLEG